MDLDERACRGIAEKYLRAVPKNKRCQPMNAHQKRAARNELLKNRGGVCFYCEEKMPEDDRTLEHMLESQFGGNNNMANLVLAHFQCNFEARGKSVAEKFLFREIMRLM